MSRASVRRFVLAEDVQERQQAMALRDKALCQLVAEGYDKRLVGIVFDLTKGRVEQILRLYR